MRAAVAVVACAAMLSTIPLAEDDDGRRQTELLANALPRDSGLSAAVNRVELDGGEVDGLDTGDDRRDWSAALRDDHLADDGDDLGSVDVETPRLASPARFTAADSQAALVGASARARCIVRVEVSGVNYDPYAVGRQGEQGIAQLHPRGLLPDFYRQGYSNAFNPYQSVEYLERALQRGLASHWAGVRLGVC